MLQSRVGVTHAAVPGRIALNPRKSQRGTHAVRRFKDDESGDLTGETVRNAVQRISANGRSQKGTSSFSGLSLFIPYTNLPPDGQVIPEKEEMCDPMYAACKTPTYVFETACPACSGTGMVRHKPNGRRGHLGTCILCTGLGYVRKTTSRFTPSMDEQTINRPRVEPHFKPTGSQD